MPRGPPHVTPSPQHSGVLRIPDLILTLQNKWEWSLIVVVMAPLTTRHPMIDPPFPITWRLLTKSAILVRKGAHRAYQDSPSEITHATFISTKNHCSAKIHRAHSSFCKKALTLLQLKNAGPYLKKNLQLLLTPTFLHFFALMVL